MSPWEGKASSSPPLWKNTFIMDTAAPGSPTKTKRPPGGGHGVASRQNLGCTLWDPQATPAGDPWVTHSRLHLSFMGSHY